MPVSFELIHTRVIDGCIASSDEYVDVQWRAVMKEKKRQRYNSDFMRDKSL